MINMTIVYTAPRSTPWAVVVARLTAELAGAYNFGSPRLRTNPDNTITVTVDAVKRGES